jgi:hypothetical protein
MNLDRVSQGVQLAANVGVILSIMFLAYRHCLMWRKSWISLAKSSGSSPRLVAPDYFPMIEVIDDGPSHAIDLIPRSNGADTTRS